MEEQTKPLTWKDVDAIAEILYEQCPDESPAQLSNAKIHEKVINIDGFSSDLSKDKISLYLSAIATRWIGLRHGIKSPEDWPQYWNIKEVCP